MSMSDEEASRILRRALDLKKRPAVTDEEVEEFLNTPGSDPESVMRVRARVADESFLSIHRKPVRQMMDLRFLSFAEWITEVRQKAALTRKETATVLGQEPSFLERLENGEVPPWETDPDTIAALMQLYRIHFDAIKSLISQTEGSRLPAELYLPPEPQMDGMFADLDLSGGEREFKPEVTRWLEELRNTLTLRQAADLLN